MKIMIGRYDIGTQQAENHTYTNIRNLEFAPEIDLIGDTLPINEFSVEISNDVPAPINERIVLLDERDHIWCRYTISDVRDLGGGFKRISAKSDIALLGKKTIHAEVYEWGGSSFLAQLHLFVDPNFPDIEYYLDPALTDVRFVGYVPEQTVRERFQLLCFIAGAYITTFRTQNGRMEIRKIPYSQPTNVPIDRVYWRPQKTAGEYISRITVRAYTYTRRAAESGESYVNIGGTIYVYTTQEFTITNPNVSEYSADTEIFIGNIGLVNTNNVSAILERLSDYYFARETLDCSILDPYGEYSLGKRIGVPVSDSQMRRGYVKAAAYTFGRGVKAKLELVMCDDVQLWRLTVEAIWNEPGSVVHPVLDRKQYSLPSGTYSIENPYIEKRMNKHQYVFRPTNQYCEGELPDVPIGSHKGTVQEPYTMALDYFEDVLYIVSVDDVSGEEGVVSIA